MIVLIMIIAIIHQIVVNYELSLNYEVSCCQPSRMTSPTRFLKSLKSVNFNSTSLISKLFLIQVSRISGRPCRCKNIAKENKQLCFTCYIVKYMTLNNI